MIPWDFDRINDKKGGSRSSSPAWFASTDSKTCSAPLINPTQQALATVGNNVAEFDYYKAIWQQLPADYSRYIQCDKITKLMALALKVPIQARSMELISNVAKPADIQAYLAHYGDLITDAQLASKDAPRTVTEWNTAIQSLYDYIIQSQITATAQAAASGITADNYQQFLYNQATGNDPTYYDLPDRPVAKVRAAAGQAILDKPTPAPALVKVAMTGLPIGSAIGTAFGSSTTFAAPQPTPQKIQQPQTQQTQQAQPVVPQMQTTHQKPQLQQQIQFPQQMPSFGSNLPGSFGGVVAFRG